MPLHSTPPLNPNQQCTLAAARSCAAPLSPRTTPPHSPALLSAYTNLAAQRWLARTGWAEQHHLT